MKIRFLNLLLILAILLPGAGLAQAAPLRGAEDPPTSLPPWDKRAANSVYGGASDEAFVGAHPSLATLAQFQAAYAASPGSTGTLPVAVPRYYGANSGGVLSSAVVNYAVQQAYLVVCSWDLGADEAVSLRINSGVTLTPHGAAGAFYCDSLPLSATALQSLRFPTAPGAASSPTDSNNGPAGSPTPANNTLTLTYPAGRRALVYEARLVVKAVRPVVLVPGFGGEASTYNWGELESLLKNSYGVITERPCDYEWEYQGWWPFGDWEPNPHHRRCFEQVMDDVADTGTLATNSRALRYAVAEVKTRYGVAKVNLVGHSKGGMFSRAYASASFYQGDVQNLVSISSPQRGGYIQDVAVGTKDFPYCDEGILDPLCEMGRGILEFLVNLVSDMVVHFKPNDGDQAGIEVTEWYYDAVLHAQHRPAAGVAYHTVAATSGLPTPNQSELDVPNHGTMAGMSDPLTAFSTIYMLNYVSDQTPNRGQSDILIAAPSQRFANMDSAYQAQEVSCKAIRANHEQSSAIVVAGRAAAFALGVRNSNTSGLLSCSGVTDLASGALQRTQAGAPSDPVSTLEFGGLVAAGRPVSATFVVDGDSFSAAGFWRDGGSFDLLLQAPDGTWVTPATPQRDAAVAYTALPLAEGASLAQYTVAKAVKGTWTAYFTPPAISSARMPSAWKLLVAQTGGVRFALTAPRAVYAAGEPVALQAVASSGAAPLTGGRASVTLSGPDTSAKSETLSLADVDLQNQAADGIYAAAFTPSAPGVYRIVVEFSGVTPDGLAYQRQDAALVAVAPDGAQLAGTYDDAGVDKDGDGLWDALRVDVGVRLTQAGAYTLIGDLRAADGTPLGSARTTVSGSAGDAVTAALEFAPELLAEHGDGPLVLGALTLLAQDQPVPVADFADVYTTAAYAAADFVGWEARRGAAEMVAQGVDLNGDGTFDALDVTLPLEVRRAGVYTVAARLALRPDLPQLEAETRLDLASAGPAVATLRFSGRDIALSGVDGPYTVANLTVEGPRGLALVEPEAGATRPFDHTQFENSVQDCIPLTGVAVAGPLDVAGTLYVDSLYTFAAEVAPVSATLPITYTWTPTPDATNGITATYRWAEPGLYTITLSAVNCAEPITVTREVEIQPAVRRSVYLPLVLREYAYGYTAPLSVELTGPETGFAKGAYRFVAAVSPVSTTTPLSYGWTATDLATISQSGGLSDTILLAWDTPGVKTVTVTVTGEGGVLSDTMDIIIDEWGGCAGNALVNGDFEDGGTGWYTHTTGTGHKVHAIIGPGLSFQGQSAAHLGGEGVWDVVSQTVVIPAGGQLSYWWRVDSAEIMPHYDWLDIALKEADGDVVASRHYDDTSDGGVWQQEVIDLTAHAGMTLTLQIDATNDNYYATMFAVDTLCLVETAR